MKLTKETLKRIIKEELDKVMNEEALSEGAMNSGEIAQYLWGLTTSSQEFNTELQSKLPELAQEMVNNNARNLQKVEGVLQKLYTIVNTELNSKVINPVKKAMEMRSVDIKKFNQWKRANEQIMNVYAELNGVPPANVATMMLKKIADIQIGKEKDQKKGGHLASNYQHEARGRIQSFLSNFPDTFTQQEPAGSEFM